MSCNVRLVGASATSPAPGTEPIGKIADHAGEQTRFERTEQEPQHVKLQRGLDKHRCDAGDAPQYGRKFFVRRPFQEQVVRNLEQHVTEVDNTDTEFTASLKPKSMAIFARC